MRRRTFLAAFATAATAVDSVGFAAGAADRATELSPNGTVAAPGVSEAVVAADGRHVFGAGHDALTVVDAGTPASPERVAEQTAEIDGETLTGIQDVAASGERALVAGPPGYIDDGQVAGAVLLDVSDPASPEQVATVQTDHPIHNAFLDGRTAYLTGSRLPEEPVLVYDVADDDPERVGRWSVVDERPAWGGANPSLHQCHDVFSQDDRLYGAFWDAGTWVLDVSDPANPTAVSHVGGVDPESTGGGLGEIAQLPGNAHYARPSPDGDLLAIGREARERDDEDGVYGGPGSIDVYDVSNESDPSFVTALRPPVVESTRGKKDVNTAHNFGFRGRRLYAAWYTGGVRVYDLSTPSDPQTLGWWAAPRNTSFWTARPLDEGFVASSVANPALDREENENYAKAELYTFPDPESGSAEPAETFAVNETGIPETRPDYDLSTTTQQTTREATTAAATAGTETTRRPTTRVGGTATERETTTVPATDEESGGSVPGFGAAAALAGASLAALHRLRGEE